MRLTNLIAGTFTLAGIILFPASLYAEETLIPGYIMASSTLVEPGYDHSAWLVQDYDTSTAWTEGAPGNGLGESLYMETDRYAVITGGVICTGYYRSEDLFYKNGAPTRIYIHTGSQTQDPEYLDGETVERLRAFADTIYKIQTSHTGAGDVQVTADDLYSFSHADVLNWYQADVRDERISYEGEFHYA